MNTKRALVCGAGGFIGSHMARRLRSEGYWVRGVDLKHPEFCSSAANEFVIADLRLRESWEAVLDEGMDEVYQFAADMGGAGYIFTGEHDAHVMHNSAMINLHAADFAAQRKAGRIFYSSSACMYPAYNQEDPQNPKCAGDDRLSCLPRTANTGGKNCSASGCTLLSRVISSWMCAWRAFTIFSGRRAPGRAAKEKAPAALMRKVAEQQDGGEIEIWGDGLQTRSFLYIDECIEAVRRLMQSSVYRPGEYRLRGDGHHQPDGRDDHGDRRQEARSRTFPARRECAAATQITT